MSATLLRLSSFHSTPSRVTPPRSDDASSTRRVASELLLGGRRELLIQHQGSEYHLRLTRNDKLILTK